MAPLVVKDKVIVGVGGGEYGIRGFIAAYDAKTGKEVWRFNTIPGPGEPGHETWSGDAWKTGGGSVWVTGSYDPALNLTYWGIGNPGPDWNPDQRPGDNLYTDSVVALDADTGTLKWHFQFTPNDGYDYDSVQVPVLADCELAGPAGERRCCGRIATASSTCSIATTGEFPARHAVREGELGERPRRERAADSDAAAAGRRHLARATRAARTGIPPSYSPRTGLFYFLRVGKLRVDLSPRNRDVYAW